MKAMKTIKGAEQIIFVGQPAALRSKSPAGNFAVVFEDDGEIGNFYALDLSHEEDPLLDTLNVYFAEEIGDRDIPCEARIVWSSDGKKALFGINLYPHAIFDFEARRGYCRTNYPEPNPAWTQFNHAWDEAALDLFREKKQT